MRYSRVMLGVVAVILGTIGIQGGNWLYGEFEPNHTCQQINCSMVWGTDSIDCNNPTTKCVSR
jgi:hypothetical protein